MSKQPEDVFTLSCSVGIRYGLLSFAVTQRSQATEIYQVCWDFHNKSPPFVLFRKIQEVYKTRLKKYRLQIFVIVTESNSNLNKKKVDNPLIWCL